jgi:hypothetical protein
MAEFFELPFQIAVDAPDTGLSALEELAELHAPGRWQCQFDCEWTCFGFQLENEAVNFLLACKFAHRYPIR